MSEHENDADQTVYENKYHEWIKATTREMTELYTSTEKTAKNLEEVKSTLFTFMETINSSIATLKTQNQMLKDENKSIKENIQTVTTKNENLKTENSSIKISNNALTAKINELETQIETVEETAVDEALITQVRDDLRAKIDELSEEQNAKIESIIERIPKSTYNCTHVQNNASDNTSKLKIPLPSFKGTENERPVKYLNDLDNYWGYK